MLGNVLAQGGWVAMVLGFSVMLYSRLNLIVDSQAIRKRILIMIILVGCIFYPFMVTLSITISVMRRNKNPNANNWARVMAPMERIQLVAILSQENIIAFFYMRAAYQYLRNRTEERSKTRKAMALLLTVQIIILILDIALLVLDFAGMLVLKLFIHSFVYSVKLELEFVVLNQLVDISQLGVPGLPPISYDPELGNKQLDSKFPGNNVLALTPTRSPDSDSLFEVESNPTYRSHLALRSLPDLPGREEQAEESCMENSSELTLGANGDHTTTDFSKASINHTSGSLTRTPDQGKKDQSTVRVIGV